MAPKFKTRSLHNLLLVSPRHCCRLNLWLCRHFFCAPDSTYRWKIKYFSSFLSKNQEKKTKMTEQKERALFQIAVSIWYFAAGADRSSVIPTVNEYLMSLGADQVYLGYVISLFAVGSIISAPLMGRLADKIGTSRPLVLFGICCHLAGSIVYFTAPQVLFKLF